MISEIEATEFVRNLPEVQDFLKGALPYEETAPIRSQRLIEADQNPTKENPYWLIHVYEFVSQNNQEGHTATQGWYQVDAQTGEIQKLQ